MAAAAGAWASPCAVAVVLTETDMVRGAAAAAGGRAGVYTADSCMWQRLQDAAGGAKTTRGTGGCGGESVMRMAAGGGEGEGEQRQEEGRELATIKSRSRSCRYRVEGAGYVDQYLKRNSCCNLLRRKLDCSRHEAVCVQRP
jgi:hypothetical protein